MADICGLIRHRRHPEHCPIEVGHGEIVFVGEVETQYDVIEGLGALAVRGADDGNHLCGSGDTHLISPAFDPAPS